MKDKPPGIRTSPLRYPGGKSRVVAELATLIPPGVNEYREPFLGGGSLFLYLKQIYTSRWFWRLSDLCPYLINFWQHCRSDADRLFTGAVMVKRKGEYTRASLREQAEEFGLSGAVAYYVLNRITFSGATFVGGVSRDACENRFNESIARKILRVSPLLQDVEIDCMDYEEAITAKGDRNGVFLFLDPPYTINRKHGLYGRLGLLHSKFDFERYVKVCRKTALRWLMTIDDSPWVREAFRKYRIEEVQRVYGMRNVTPQSAQVQQELVIMNYDQSGRLIK